MVLFAPTVFATNVFPLYTFAVTVVEYVGMEPVNTSEPLGTACAPAVCCE